MKLAPVIYHRANALDEALRLLSETPDAMVLAGGQSLMPMLNLRLAAPAHLIDINRLAELDHIREEGDFISMGAMTRQRTIEFSELIAAKLPLLALAIRHVGHRQTRNRGTLGGSLCNLDPAAELALVTCLYDGVMVIDKVGLQSRCSDHEPSSANRIHVYNAGGRRIVERRTAYPLATGSRLRLS